MSLFDLSPVYAKQAKASRDAIDNRIYPGSYGADPTTRPDGSARQNGDLANVNGVVKTFNLGVWGIVTGASAADLANSVDPAKGASLVGHDGTTLAGVMKDRVFRRVADVAALRALDSTKCTAAHVVTYSADTGAAAGVYLLDAVDVTTTESLPYVVVGSDGGRWKLSGPMAPASQDSSLLALIARDRGDPYTRNLPRQLALSADNSAVGLELPLHIGTRRNIWQRTEDFAHASYAIDGGVRTTDSIVIDGITLTRLTTTGFNDAVRSNIIGLGLTPFVAGQRYLVSYYALARGSSEQFVLARPVANSASQAHGAKLLVPNRMRRIWSVVGATSTTNTDSGAVAGVALGAGAGNQNLYWFQQGNTEGGGAQIFLGGFMIEKLADATYKDGIALIGDSTMAGGAGKMDFMQTTAREVSTWLGALLNVPVFNRAVGGERTDAMDARWATDITPLAVNCKYAIIQGGINDIGQGRALVDIQTSITSMVNKATADGMLPVLFTCTPSETMAATATMEADRQSLNAWLKSTFPRVIDIAAVVQDPSDGKHLRRAKGWFGDGVHYGSAAKRAVAAYVAQWNGWDFVTPSPYQAIAAEVYAPPGSAVVHNGVQVVGARDAGWTPGTGTPLKGAFAADTATATQTAQRVLALEQALRTHGLIS